MKLVDSFETGWMDSNKVVTGHLISQSADDFEWSKAVDDGFKSFQGLPCLFSDHFKAICFNGTNTELLLKCPSMKPECLFETVFA